MKIDLNDFKNNNSTVEVKEKKIEIIGFKKTISDKKKEAFYRELFMLIKSGVDFKKALEIMSYQAQKGLESTTINQIKNQVIAGKTICEAMITTKQFSPYEYYSVQIGEETRKLEEVLDELQKFFKRKVHMRRQIISVITYPAIVMLVTLSVLYFMLNKVVPMFSTVFKQFNSELPQSTQIIIKISNHSGVFFSAFILLVLGFIVFHYFFKNNETYRKLTTSIILKTPYFGKLIKKIYLSRFCQSMNLLTSSKTSLLTSLTLTSRMIGFYPIEKSISIIQEDITKGITFGNSLKKHAIYENKLISMIEVAEQVNQIDTMFEKLSEQYNEDINHQTKILGVILEPLIIIFIGVIVGVIMISMYAPMFDLSKIIRN